MIGIKAGRWVDCVSNLTLARTSENRAWLRGVEEKMGRMAIVFFVLMTSVNLAQATTATVIAVYDGDTFAVDRRGEEIKIKLYGIDAPEAGQHGNVSSTRFLKRLILDYSLQIKEIETDLFGRIVAIAIREGKESSVNAAMVSQGYAWVNPSQCLVEECNDWKKLESQARRLKLGIWSGFDLEPPWEFRKSQTR